MFYFCDATYNMCNPTPWAMGQTLWNQQAADIAAKFPTYCVYNMSMPSSFTQFANPASGDLNTIFNNIMENTLAQFNTNMQNGGLYNNTGLNLSGQTSSSSSSSDSNLSSEEKTAKSKFLKLQKLISTYRNTHDVSDEELLTNIDSALKKGSKETYVEALDEIQDVYEQIKEYDKEGLREALTLIDKKVDYNSSTLVHDYRTGLVNGGYDYSDYSMDGAPEDPINIGDVHTEVTKQQVNSEHYKPSGDFYSQLALSTAGVDNNILAVLGHWNNEYGTKDSGKERSIIRVFANKINKVGKSKDEKYESESRMDYLDANMKPFVDALRHKGEYSAKNLKFISSTEKTKIKELSTKLNTDYEQLSKKSDMTQALKTLVKDFEKLYVTLRLAEAKNSQLAIQKDYGFIEDIKQDNFIINDTIEDLKREGFTTTDIDNSDVSVTQTEETESTDSTETTDNTDDTDATDRTPTTDDTDDIEEEEIHVDPDFNAKGAGKNVRHLLSSWTTKSDATIINNKLQSVNSENVLEFLDGYYENGKKPVEGLIEKLDDDASPNVTMKTKLKLLESILKKAKELGLDEDDDVKDAYNTIKEIVSLYKTDYSGEQEFNKTYSNSGFWSHKGKWDSVLTTAGTCATAGAVIGGTAGFGVFSWATGPIGAVIGGAVGLVGGWFGGLCDRVTDNEVLDDAIQKLYQKIKEE